MKINDVIRKLRSKENSTKLLRLDMQKGEKIFQKTFYIFLPHAPLYVRLRADTSYETCTDFLETLIFRATT